MPGPPPTSPQGPPANNDKPRPPWVVVPPTLSEATVKAKKSALPSAKPATPAAPVAPPFGKEAKPAMPAPLGSPPPGIPTPKTPPAKKSVKDLIKKSPFRKIIPIVLGLLVLLLLFFLVTKVLLPLFTKESGEPSPGKELGQEPVTLTYWGLWEEEAIMDVVIKDYQAEFPHVTIDYVYQSHRDYRERLQSAFAREEGPDIFRFHNTWQPMLKKELAPVPATTFSQTEFKETFYPVAFKDLSSQGEILGIPLMFDGLALFYNPSLLEAAGQTVPKTWDELRETAKEITVYDAQGKIQTAGVALGTTENVEHFSDILGLMILQNEADPGEPSEQLVQDALTFYTLFRVKDHVWDETLPTSFYAFATEKVAMIFAPSWQAFAIKEINPNLVFKTAKVPQLSSKEIGWATYWVEGVSSQSENPEEAFAFLKYLASATTMKKIYNEASTERLFGEPYSRVDLAQELEDDSVVGAFVQQGPSAQSWYLASRTYDNGLNDKLIKYYQDAINSLVEGESADDVFEILESGVSQVLSQYSLP